MSCVVDFAYLSHSLHNMELPQNLHKLSSTAGLWFSFEISVSHDKKGSRQNSEVTALTFSPSLRVAITGDGSFWPEKQTTGRDACRTRQIGSGWILWELSRNDDTPKTLYPNSIFVVSWWMFKVTIHFILGDSRVAGFLNTIIQAMMMMMMMMMMMDDDDDDDDFVRLQCKTA